MDSTSENNPNDKWKVGDGAHWRIWSVADKLEANGLSSSSDSNSNPHKRRRIVDDGTKSYVQNGDEPNGEKNKDSQSESSRGKKTDDLTQQVVEILREWGTKWAGQTGWQTLLNKKSLLHEVEESIVALQILIDWLERRENNGGSAVKPVTLIDVCCGKGILSMLASYVFRNKTTTRVSGIIMLDKQKNIDWDHISASNEVAEKEGRPIIETWGGCNLHNIDEIVERLEGHTSNNGQLALVGIHLCKLLSPSCAGVVNSLGPDKAPFLCLAPCCLPRVVTTISKSSKDVIQSKKNKKDWSGKEGFNVPVRTFETIEERQARNEANLLRAGAKKRSVATQPCYLCAQMDHPMHKCSLLPPDENERLEIFKKAAIATPCWKCGEVGHFRADCPSTQETAKPRLTLPPTMDLDVASVIRMEESVDGTQEKKAPFENYCDLLATALQRDNVKVLDVGLVNNSAQHDNSANADNWNRHRKSIFIVASES